jgi:hypothetical protein
MSVGRAASIWHVIMYLIDIFHKLARLATGTEHVALTST